MQIQSVPINDLVFDPANVRTHDNKNIDAIMGSLARFGQQKPIVVNAEGVVIAGNGTLAAAKALGWTQINTVKTELVGSDITAYAIADNRTADLADWDDGALVQVLAALEIEDEALLAAAGFSPAELEALVNETSGMEEEGEPTIPLADQFVVPPFTVLDSRQGYWLDRKRHWRSLIKDNCETRESALGWSTLLNVINEGGSLLDPVLAELIVRWFGMEGGHCVDPFAGDTVFGYVASALGHKFTGIEIRADQAALNNERTPDLAVYHNDDGQNVGQYLEQQSTDLVFSCPPYFDLEVYSDDPKDASNQGSYGEFLDILDNAFGAAVATLKHNRFAVIVIGDVRDEKGAYRLLPDMTKTIMTGHGMVLLNELIFVEPVGTLSQRARRYMRNRKVGKCHQNVQVFYNGNPQEVGKHFPEVPINVGEDME
ncbi:hypothetical protein CMI37_18075 [Candidatus Pacearchaeota archaeon]|nr:hypothetical protein [Candidatus Pacearchaeota archaeon]